MVYELMPLGHALDSSKVVPVHLRSAFWSQEAESVREEKQGILYLQLSSRLGFLHC